MSPEKPVSARRLLLLVSLLKGYTRIHGGGVLSNGCCQSIISPSASARIIAYGAQLPAGLTWRRVCVQKTTSGNSHELPQFKQLLRDF